MKGATHITIIVSSESEATAQTVELLRDEYRFATVDDLRDYINRLDVWCGVRPMPKQANLKKILPRGTDPMSELERILDFPRDDDHYEKGRVFDQTAE